MEVMDKNEIELEALAETGDKIKVGDRDYIIYPMTLGKIKLIGKKLSSFAPLIGFLDADISNRKKADKDFAKLISQSIDDVIVAFGVLTSPNNGKPPAELSKGEIEFLEWHMNVPKIIEILMTLKKQASIEGLLKNVSPLKEKKNLAGQDSFRPSSESQDGDSIT